MDRINIVCLGVRDLNKSLDFYRHLGFQTTAEENSPIVFFNNQGSRLAPFPLEELAADINADLPPTVSPSGFSGVTLACNLRSRIEVDQIFDLARKVGAQIAKEPQRTDWGGYGGYFQDPDGYFWEVAYSDEWQFDEADMLVID